MRPGVLALLVLLLASGSAAAFAEERAEGTLTFHDAPRLAGNVTWTATRGALDLTPAVAVGERVVLSLDGADGYKVRRWTTLVAGYRNVERPFDNDTLSLSGGTLTIDGCVERCQVVLLPSVGARFGLAGGTSDVLRWAPTPVSHWALANTTGVADAAHVEHPAGTFLAGAEEGAMPALDAVARAEGRFLLLLLNTTALHVARDGATTALDARPTVGPVTTVLGVPGTARESQTYFMLELRGVAYESAPATRATAYAIDPTIHLDGALRSDDAEGTLRSERGTHVAGRQSVLIEGAFDVEPRVESNGLVPLLSRQRVSARVEGDATTLRIGDRAIVDAAARVAAVEASLAALLLLAATYVLRHGVLGPLFSRIPPARVLDNENRRALFDVIKQKPGATARGLAREAGLSRMVVRHHIGFLKQHGFVVERGDPDAPRYYATAAAPTSEKVVLDVVLENDKRRVILALVSEGPVTQSELVARTGISQRLISYHLARLAEAGIVSADDGFPARYQLASRALQDAGETARAVGQASGP